uniref:C-type lectin domain-containing protein n=1 Tax=Astyanax mexicanus TaxID=7994 RepID=A0A3B1J7M2_ASTMX
YCGIVSISFCNLEIYLNPTVCISFFNFSSPDKLVLIQEKLTWKGALRYCRENHVDLVSVHSEEIQLWVKDVAQKASTDHVWLGLRHTCTLSFWFWVGNAVQARGDQKWVSLPENQTLNFICIKYEVNCF